MKLEIKYAPKNLSEVIYENAAHRLQIQAYSSALKDRHLMLYGPNGTGKSTVAKLLVSAIGGDDASIETKPYKELLSMPELDDYLANAVSLARFTSSGKHFLLFDEFDNAKKGGLSDFWTALDRYGDGLMAIITTNEPMAIHPSVRSRFDMVKMPSVSAVAALPRVQYMLQAEGLQLPDQQVLSYLKEQEPLRDLRKYFQVAASLLSQHADGLLLAPWSETTPSFKVV